jgi:pilus assembly protein FimV
MTAAPPDATKPEDDLGLDDLLADIDSASPAPGKDPAPSSVDMDFEKELEDLFSDDPAPAPAAAKTPASDPFDDLLNSAASDADDPGDVLLLEDVVEESAESGEDDGLLVLGAADEIELDLPGDVGGASGGDIDHAGLDNLIDDLGDGGKAKKAAPSPDAGLDDDLDALLASDGPADASSLDDDLDALLNDVSPAAPAAAQPEAASPSLDDDLDALLGEAETMASPAAVSPDSGLDDDLDALLGEASPTSPEAPAPAAAPDDDLDALLTDLGQAVQPGPAADAGGLDDLLDDLGVAPTPEAAPAVPADEDLDALLGESASPAPPPASGLDDDLDALLADAAPASAPAAEALSLDDDLDLLLADAPQAPQAPAPAPEEEPVPDLEDLLSAAAETPPAAGSAPDEIFTSEAAPAAAAPDDDLEGLLAGFDAVAAPAETAAAPEGPDTGDLDLDLATPEFPDGGDEPAPGEDNLDALIAGLDDPSLAAPAPPSGDEPDVDDLLAELDEADATPAAALDSLDALDDEPGDGELPDLSSPDSELDALLAAMEDPAEPAAQPGEAGGEALTPEEAGLFTAPPTEDDELSELLAEQALAHGQDSAQDPGQDPALDLPAVLPAAHDMDLDAILAQDPAARPGATLDDAPLRLEDAAARIARLEEELKAKNEALHTLEDRLAALESAGLAAGAASGPSAEALLGTLGPDSDFVQELKRLVLEDVASRLESLVPAAAARIIREEISVLAEELDQ